MTQEGIPLLGNFEDGNAAETELFRKLMTQLAGMLDDLRGEGAVMIGDSKLCSVPTMAQAADLKMPILTLVPENWNFRREAIAAAACRTDLPVLLVTEEGEEYRGESYQIPVLIEEDGKPGRSVWLRLMAVHSTQLALQKEQTRLRAMDKERKDLERWAKKLGKRAFACEADARKVLDHEWSGLKAKFHTMTATVRAEERLEKRKPGRPTAGATLKKKVVWNVTPAFAAVERPPVTGLDPEGFFVLMTTVTDHRKMSDADMLKRYKDQKVVEIGFHWLKGPLEISPMFLKKRERIQAMGFIFLLALLVGALIQRDLRKGLRREGGTVAYFGGKRTDTPTWNSVLSLFEKIRATWIKVGETWQRVIHHFDADHQRILDLMDLSKAYLGN
jgi:transposase